MRRPKGLAAGTERIRQKKTLDHVARSLVIFFGLERNGQGGATSHVPQEMSGEQLMGES